MKSCSTNLKNCYTCANWVCMKAFLLAEACEQTKSLKRFFAAWVGFDYRKKDCNYQPLKREDE